MGFKIIILGISQTMTPKAISHIPIIDIKSCHHIPIIVIMITAFTNHDVFSKTIPTNKSSMLKQLLLTLNNCCLLRTIAAH